jgi:hypothetical protein
MKTCRTLTLTLSYPVLDRGRAGRHLLSRSYSGTSLKAAPEAEGSTVERVGEEEGEPAKCVGGVESVVCGECGGCVEG